MNEIKWAAIGTLLSHTYIHAVFEYNMYIIYPCPLAAIGSLCTVTSNSSSSSGSGSGSGSGSSSSSSTKA